ncbi:MAG: tetratricopeptide repeat protein [Bacteroidetes bacterium]|nr:tetratricopeptide repeat protein [Bacteroidota bacterium]
MKRLFLSIFLLILTISLNAQSLEDNQEAAKLYNEGNKLSKSGNYLGAVDKYNEALKSIKDYRVFYQKGVTLKKLNKYSEAEEAFLKCAEANPKFDLAYNGLGGAYFADGKYLEAADAFKKFEQLTQKAKLKSQAKEYRARALTKLASDVKADGKYDKAVEHLKDAVNDFKFDAAYLLLAEIYVETQKYQDALAAADNALNSRKTITKGGPLYYKGKAFKGMEDIAKAKEAFNAGKADPKYKGLCEYELKLMN